MGNISALVLCGICLGSFWAFSAAATDRIILWERNYNRPYFHEIITLAAELSKEKYGDYELVSSEPIEQGRAFNTLHAGQFLNVAIAGIDNEREKQGIPIYIPIDRGLLGFRLCLLHESVLSLGSKNPVKDFIDQKILLGVGTHWPDKEILESNGLSAVHTPIYEHLFDMLNAKRFECLPRSVSEIDEELDRFSHYNFNVEPDFALVYPQADFIFVSTAHQGLHERLDYGLRKALESGAFNEFFDIHYQQTLFKHAFYERKVIYLHNRNLSINALDAINTYGVASFSNPQVIQSRDP